MSNRHPYETKAIETLIGHLRSSGSGDFLVEAEHVPVGRKNCDFLLAPRTGPGRKVAVEVVRVVDNQAEMEVDYFRGIHWEALKAELKALGVDGVLIRTPWSIRTVPRETQKVVVPGLARRIKAALDADPDSKSVMVDGHEVVRIADLSGVVPSANTGAHYVNRPLLTEILLTTLEDKDAQLALSDVDRVLLAVAWSTSLDADGISRQLARRTDLERLRNTDRVVFIDRSAAPATVYSRGVRDFFDGQGPFPAQDRELTSLWFTTRLTDNHSTAFDLVRATASTRNESLDFLDAEAKSALAHHGTQLVELGRHDDALWVIRKLRDDADPPIESRPSSGGICTVRGTTAWLAHRLAAAVPVAGLPELVRVAEAFARDANVYIREMASFALRVLMARRDELSDGHFVMPEELRSEVKRVWRAYLDAAPADGLADDAASTLAFVYDLSEAELAHVIETLIEHVTMEGMRGLARSAIYFTHLRPNETGMPTHFDGAQLRARVHGLLASNPEFRGEISFVVFRSMKDHPEVRRAMAGLVRMLLDLGPEDRSTGFALECVAMLAADALLDEATERKALECLGRAKELGHHVRMELAFRLGEACETLVAAGQADRVDRWLGLVDDSELLEFVERKRSRMATATA